MSPGQAFSRLFGALGAVLVVVVGGVLWSSLEAALDGDIERVKLFYPRYLGISLLLLLPIVGGSWFLAVRRVAKPLDHILGVVVDATHIGRDEGLGLPAGHALGTLPERVDELMRALSLSRAATQDAIASATSASQYQKGRLEAILYDLAEGVLVCNLNHQVMLYNHRALGLLHGSGQLGLGRSALAVLTADPIQHALGQLKERALGGGATAQPHERTVSFVCSTRAGDTTLDARMCLVPGPDGSAGGYVLTLTDVTAAMVQIAHGDSLLREAIEGMRPPVANLVAALETTASSPDMPMELRRSFDDVALAEASALARRLETLSASYQQGRGSHWPVSDIQSIHVIGGAVRLINAEGAARATMTGLPCLLSGDEYILTLGLVTLAQKVIEHTRIDFLDIAADPGPNHVYIDIVWHGRPIPSATLEGWLDERLSDVMGGLTLRQMLEQQGSALWSESPRPGESRLRMPLKPGERAQARASDTLPSRPEFYDFSLLGLEGSKAGADRLLRDCAFVVFDTETTGLRPSTGDQMVSIAGVRVFQGRMLSGETFSQLVNPGMSIPTSSIRFHGITDDMVVGQPDPAEALDRFHGFVGDAVLVAHNIAFDITFIRMQEKKLGYAFDQPLLDTLLLSAFLYPEIEDHSLDAVTARLGIEVEGRHTALGDAMVTAAVFVRLIEMLETRGVKTLRDAVSACNKVTSIRQMQANF
ncbi:MAG: exonuclease domain-containing protein [Magnetospirillum sp. WYHS-4]